MVWAGHCARRGTSAARAGLRVRGWRPGHAAARTAGYAGPHHPPRSHRPHRSPWPHHHGTTWPHHRAAALLALVLHKLVLHLLPLHLCLQGARPHRPARSHHPWIHSSRSHHSWVHHPGIHHSVARAHHHAIRAHSTRSSRPHRSHRSSWPHHSAIRPHRTRPHRSHRPSRSHHPAIRSHWPRSHRSHASGPHSIRMPWPHWSCRPHWSVSHWSSWSHWSSRSHRCSPRPHWPIRTHWHSAWSHRRPSRSHGPVGALVREELVFEVAEQAQLLRPLFPLLGVQVLVGNFGAWIIQKKKNSLITGLTQ